MADGIAASGDEVHVLTDLPNYPKGRIFDGYRSRLKMTEKTGNITIYRYWVLALVSKSKMKRGLALLSFAFTLWGFARHWIRIRSYDRVIIQTPHLLTAGSAMLLFKCLYGKKVFLNVSDVWPQTAVELGAVRPGSMPHKFFSAIERFLYRKADGVIGQSNEILDFVAHFPNKGNSFLYRNVPRYTPDISARHRPEKLKIVYAGLLGVAQDLLGVVQHIDFKALGMELHLYGGGAQKKDIEEYISTHDCSVYYHGFLSKEQTTEELRRYDASLVPLTVRLTGAIPSKIYDILPMGMPVVFSGGGEGAKIIEAHKVGFTSEPGDYDALQRNLQRLAGMSKEEYEAMSERCIEASNGELNFESQIKRCVEFMNKAI